MLVSFPYLAMTITGVIHIIFGVAIFITACIGFNVNIADSNFYEWQRLSGYEMEALEQVLQTYLGTVVGSALWIIMVGILGICTGWKTMDHKKTRGLKIAYMVTAILSAVIFSQVGLILCVVVINQHLYYIGLAGTLCSVGEFILAIVSSSICCCCAQTSVGGIVVVQAPGNQNLPPSYPGPGNMYPGQQYSVQQYPASGPAFAMPQVPEEGFTNPGYQPTGQSVAYTVKNEVA